MFQENQFAFFALNKYRTKENNIFPAQALLTLKNLRVKLRFLVKFNIIISYIFPENFIEIQQVV